MKLQCVASSIIAALSLFIDSGSAWSQSELVTGSYDPTNDWFTFDWIDPEHGKQHSVLDPGNKVKPEMQVFVSFDTSTSTYTYTYQIKNLVGARQLLKGIYVKHLSAVFDATAPAPSNEWNMGEYQNKGIWSWAKTRGAVHGIPAGEGVTGASFKSKGLPTIVDSQFSGQRRGQYIIPGDETPDDIDKSFDRVYAKLQAQYPDKWADTVKQKTVGPVDLPTTFNAASFIQTLITLVNQSRTRGWIDNDGIANSLRAKLNTANSKVTGDSKTAKNVLGAFLSEVQSQNGKHLSSEAYALLFFNGKYLLDSL